jgi:putative transposase
VDTLGLVLALAVHPADVQGRGGAALALARLRPLFRWVRTIFADAAYDGGRVAVAGLALGITALIIVRRLAVAPGCQVLPKGWIVERTFGWLGRRRRLARDDEQLPEVSEAMIRLAMIRLMLQRLTRPQRRELPSR